MKKKLKVAITGGIGSGKSLVGEYFERCGFPIIKADDLAKEIMQTDQIVKKKIMKAFGKESFNENRPNTKFIAENVFSDQQKVEQINGIIHPPTIKKIDVLANQLFLKNDIVFVESALVYEAKIQKLFDFVILVFADEQTRISRIKEVRKLSEEEIRKRMQFQIPDENKMEKAHFTIENNSTIQDLEKRSQFVLALLKSFVGQSA